MALVTGSRKYGTPGPVSDLDLVVLVSKEDLMILADFAGPCELKRAEDYPDDQLQIRFGGLNLLRVTRAEDYYDWLDGTNTLAAAKPVQRHQAVALFDELRATTKARREGPQKAAGEARRSPADLEPLAF